MNTSIFSFLRNKSMFYFLSCALFSAVILSCSDKEDNIISSSTAATSIEAKPSPTKNFLKNQGQILYAYSTISLSVPDSISKELKSNDVFYRIDIEKITASMADNSPIPIKYEIGSNNIISIYPDEYFSKSGKLLLNIQLNWKYWENIKNPPSSDISEWKDYKQETVSVEYDVLARVAPLNVFDADNIQSVSANIYYIPQTKVAYLPGNIVENQYKYELESSLDNFTLLPSIEENDMNIYYNFEGQLQFQKNYTFTAKAKWYRNVNGSWVKCADALDETFTQNIVTSEQGNAQWTMQDIEFHYPLDRQFNFLPKEYNKGYIKLSTATLLKQYATKLPYVEFEEIKTNWKRQSEVSYNENLKVFEYDLPQDYFEPEKVYQISFKDRTTDALIYSYYFKTSKFNNFAEKWASLRTSFAEKWRDPIIGGPGGLINYHLQKINMKNCEEVVDVYETYNSNFADAKVRSLIQFNTHVLDGWKNTLNWYIYSQPSVDFNRKGDEMNWFLFPPTDAIYFIFNSPKPTLSDNSCLTGDVDFYPQNNIGVFVWAVKAISDLDVRSAIEYASQIPAEKRTEAQQRLAALSGYYYPYIVPAGCPVLQIDMALGGDPYPLLDVYYVLPGLGIKTTTISDVQL